MKSADQFGVVLYQLSIGIEAWLLGYLVMKKKAYRSFPAFTGYTAFCVIRSILLFYFLATTTHAYWYAYRIGLALGVVMLGWVCGELVKRPAAGFCIGSILSAALVATNYQPDLIRLSKVLVLLACAYVLFAANGPVTKLLATGLLVMTIFPAVSELSAAYSSEAVRYIPTISFILAQAIWIKGFVSQTVRPFVTENML